MNAFWSIARWPTNRAFNTRLRNPVRASSDHLAIAHGAAFLMIAAAKGIANGLQKQPISKLNELAADGVLKVICHGKREQ